MRLAVGKAAALALTVELCTVATIPSCRPCRKRLNKIGGDENVPDREPQHSVAPLAYGAALLMAIVLLALAAMLQWGPSN